MANSFCEICSICGHWWHQHLYLKIEPEHSFIPYNHVEQVHQPQLAKAKFTLTKLPCQPSLSIPKLNEINPWKFVIQTLEQSSEKEMKEILNFVSQYPQSKLATCFQDILKKNKLSVELQESKLEKYPFLISIIDAQPPIYNCVKTIPLRKFSPPFYDFDQRLKLLKNQSNDDDDECAKIKQMTTAAQLDQMLNIAKPQTKPTIKMNEKIVCVDHDDGKKLSFNSNFYSRHYEYRTYIEIQVPNWIANFIYSQPFGPWSCLKNITTSFNENPYLNRITGMQLWAMMQSMNPYPKWWEGKCMRNDQTQTTSFFLPIPRPWTGQSISQFSQLKMDIMPNSFHLTTNTVRKFLSLCFSDIVSPGMTKMIQMFISDQIIRPNIQIHQMQCDITSEIIEDDGVQQQVFFPHINMNRMEQSLNIQKCCLNFSRQRCAVLNVVCFHANGQPYLVAEPHAIKSFQLLCNNFASNVESAEHWFSKDKQDNDLSVSNDVRLYTKTFVRPTIFEIPAHLKLTGALRHRPHFFSLPYHDGFWFGEDLEFICQWSTCSQPGDYLHMWFLESNIMTYQYGMMMLRYST